MGVDRELLSLDLLYLEELEIILAARGKRSGSKIIDECERLFAGRASMTVLYAIPLQFSDGRDKA